MEYDVSGKPVVTVGFLDYSANSAGASRATERIVTALQNSEKSNRYRLVRLYIEGESTTKDSKLLIGRIVGASKMLLNLWTGWKTLYRLLGGRGEHSLATFRTGRLTELQEFDILVINWLGDKTISLSELVQSTIPTVVIYSDYWFFSGTSHFPSQQRWNHFLDMTMFGLFQKKVLSIKRELHEKAVVARVSPSLGTELKARRFLPFPKAFSRIPYPVDTATWFPKNQTTARIDLGLRRNGNIVGVAVAGRLDNPRKGLGRVFKSFARVDRGQNPWFPEIALVGGLPRRGLRALAWADYYLNQLEEEDLCSFFSAIDLLIMPSYYETAPQVILEAALCGTPTLAFSRVDGVAEVIVDGKTGYVVRDGEQDFLDTLRRAFEDGPPLAKLGMAARDLAMSYATPEISAEKWTRLLDEISEEIQLSPNEPS